MRLTAIAAIAALSTCGALSGQTLGFYDPNAYRDIHLTFSQTNWWTQLLANFPSGTDIPANMTVDGVSYPNVGVRFRGNTSYVLLPPGSQKMSFNIRMDSFVPGQDVLGYDNLNLNNGFQDPTFLREFLTYMVCRRYGPAPGCNFVRLFLNGQYWGVYINVQQPNKDMMGEWFRSNDGNRYRGIPTSGSSQNGRCALMWLGPDVNDYLSAYQAKSGDGTDLMHLCDVLNNTPSSQLQGVLPDIFSVDQFYRYAACMNILTQTDSYIGSGKDHFLYHDDVYGAFHMFPFDVNESLSGSSTLDPLFNATSSIKPALSKTMPFADWNARYIAHYRTIVEQTLSWAVLGPVISHYHGMIETDVVNDTKKIYSTQSFFDNVTMSVFLGWSLAPGLQPLIQSRSAFLLSHPLLTAPRATLSNLQHAPSQPNPGQVVTVTVDATSEAAGVSLFSRSSGAFTSTPMFDDGAHGDGAAGDGTWGVTLGSMASGTLLDYYVQASTNQGELSFMPETAEHRANTLMIAWPTAPSPVTINEFVAKNNTVIADPAGEYEDYLELFNASSSPVSIGGMHLTDDLTNPTKWDIPPGEVIPPLGTTLIWCDEDGSQGPLHANFKLSANGETVALFAPDGVTLLDVFAFGPQLADSATGRLFDGGPMWLSLGQPSPDARNELSGCGSRTYTALDPLSHVMTLSVIGTPRVGSTSVVEVGNGLVSGSGTIYVSPAPNDLKVAGTSLTALLDLTSLSAVPVSFDANGDASRQVGIPNDPALVGLTLYLQAAAFDQSGFPHASNGLEAVVCP